MISAIYCLIALSVDRVIATWKPALYVQNSKSRHAFTTCIIIHVASLILGSSMFFFARIEDGVCGYYDIKGLPAEFTAIFALSMSIGLFLLVPLVMLIATTIMILFKIRGRESSKGSRATRERKEKEITRSLVSMTVSYCVIMMVAVALVVLGLKYRDSNSDVFRTMLVSVLF